jgi:type III secretion system FlhB-like substrate exporter
MPNVALIFEGFLAGSTSVKVYAEEIDGTTIVLCDENDLSVLGTGTISNNEAVITPGVTLIEGQRIIAFVGSAGTAGGREVLVSGYISTGWKKPLTITVGETEYTVEEYEAATGNQVPLIYDPSCVNRMSEQALKDTIPSETPISFLVRIDRDITQTVVSVEDVLGIAEFLIQFDSDAAGNDDMKIYDANGTYQVKVIDAADATRQTTRIYTIDVTTEPPAESEISNASYVQSSGVYPIIEIIADSNLALECKVDGVTNYLDMDLIGGKRWRYSNLPLPATGTYIARVRVKTDTADAVAMNATIF